MNEGSVTDGDSSFLCNSAAYERPTLQIGYHSPTNSPPPEAAPSRVPLQQCGGNNNNNCTTPACTPRQYTCEEMMTPQPSRAEVELRMAVDREVIAANSLYHYENVTAMAELLPFLFVGSFPTEATVPELRAHGITHILNVCAQQEKTRVCVASEFIVDTLSTFDEPDYYILTYNYEKFAAVVDSVRNLNGRLLVHCIGGINRSVTLCIAYLLQRCHWELLTAIRHVRQQGRRVLLENAGFRHQLVEFALSQGNNATPRSGTSSNHTYNYPCVHVRNRSVDHEY